MQPFTAKMLAVSFVGLQLLLCSLRMCAAHSTGLDVQICETLHVSASHGSVLNSVNERVTVLLRKMDGTLATCVEPSKNYRVQLISYARDFKGFILQADKGAFPTDEIIDLPDGTNRGPCTKSVSHRQKLRTRDLRFGFRSGKQAVTFRFTVVFIMSEYMSNQNVTFPKCPTPPPGCENVTDSDSPIEREESREPHDTNETENPEVTGMCGKDVSSQYMTMKYVSKSGIQYSCRSKIPLKQVSCESSCEGRCNCKPKDVIPKRRGFICHSCSLDTPEEHRTIEETFKVKITTRCVCFQCSNFPGLTGS